MKLGLFTALFSDLTLDEEVYPPLFYLVLRLWRDVLGGGEMAARLLPCAASMATLKIGRAHV